MTSTIFVIDSSPAVRRMVEQISTPEGYEVVGFQDGPAALDAARTLAPRLIIADYHLDNMTFSGFCKEVHKLDSLSETYIISLVGAADRLDESHLRSLGVKAFLKKPFQTEHLLDLIKDLDRTGAARANGAKKKRTWPPVTSATDSDDEEGSDQPTELDQTGEIEAAIIPAAAPVEQASVLQPVAESGKQPEHESEDVMKGLFAPLFQSLSEKAEKQVADALPELAGRHLAGHVASAVEAEVNQQLGATLTQERLTRLLEPLLARELPRILSRDLPELEPILRHSIVEVAGPLIKEYVEESMREQREALKAAVPEAVREHLKTIDGRVQEEIRKAAIEQTEKLAGDILRAAANDRIQETVRDVVPGIAEEQIKIELKRLTKAA